MKAMRSGLTWNSILCLKATILVAMATGCGPNPEEVKADYQAALTAVNVGDCETALPLLESVYEDGEEITLDEESSSLRNLAANYQSACKALADLPVQIQAEPAKVLERLPGIYNTLKDSSLEPTVAEYFARLWEENSIEDLATGQACRRWHQILENQVELYLKHLPSPQENGPKFLKHCADNVATEFEGSPEARNFYRTFIALYPDREEIETVKASLAQETREYVEKQPRLFQSIGQPTGSPAEGDFTFLALANATKNPMEITIVGENETIVETIARCEDCAEGSKTCDRNAPIFARSIEPGKYQVVVEAITLSDSIGQQLGFYNSQISAYTGTWELGDRQIYSQCFYVSDSSF